MVPSGAFSGTTYGAMEICLYKADPQSPWLETNYHLYSDPRTKFVVMWRQGMNTCLPDCTPNFFSSLGYFRCRIACSSF